MNLDELKSYFDKVAQSYYNELTSENRIDLLQKFHATGIEDMARQVALIDGTENLKDAKTLFTLYEFSISMHLRTDTRP